MHRAESLLRQAVDGFHLNKEEALFLYREARDGALMEAADQIRRQLHPSKEVGWIIDRNVNITNICLSFCSFCNFCRRESDEDAYITTLEEYREKISELFRLGGSQLLLQGGMHPKLGLSFYKELFSTLKNEFPTLKLHALGPPEVVHLARLEGLSYRQVLEELVASGMDSLPGAGAEILSERVRTIVSKAKCSAAEWLDVMREAHRMNLVTSATMMYGHVETDEERVDHLLSLRDLQDAKPQGSRGFLNFVPWPFMDEGTVLKTRKGVANSLGSRDYIRLLALSRILLPNIPNIQASWLTVGIQTAQLCLHAGANDFGSIMIEEHVVSAAGASYRMDADGIQKAIRDAGFTPRLRDQSFAWLT